MTFAAFVSVVKGCIGKGSIMRFSGDEGVACVLLFGDGSGKERTRCE